MLKCSPCEGPSSGASITPSHALFYPQEYQLLVGGVGQERAVFLPLAR